MASFFGYGRRKEESDIPMCDSSQQQQQQQPESTQDDDVVRTRAASPPRQGPPTTHPSFVPSPVLRPPGGRGSGQASKLLVEPPATENMAIPIIHIFNPAENTRHYQTEEDLEEDYMEDNPLHLKPPLDSYGTATEETEQYNHYNHNMNNPHQHKWQPGVETVQSAENDDSQSEDDQDNLQQFVTASPSVSASASEEEPVPVTSNAEVELDEQDDQFLVHNDLFPLHNHVATPPLRETVTDTKNNDLKPSPIYTYSDDSHSTLTPSTPSSINPFRTPLTKRGQVAIVFDESDAVRRVLPPKSPRVEIFTPHFKEVHAKTVRRRQNYQRHMQTLERRLASITAKLANITMDRQAQEAHWFCNNIAMPLDDAAQRAALEIEYQTSPHFTGTKNWMAFMTRLSRLETDMTQYDHVQFSKLVREKLEQPYLALHQESLNHASETKKSEKREGGILRQFESLAATARRRYHEERAARTGAYEVMRQRLVEEAKMETDPKRIEELLAKVRALRSMLEQERVERRMQDEHWKTAIDQEVISMKRALLEAAGGDELIEESAQVRRTIAYS